MADRLRPWLRTIRGVHTPGEAGRHNYRSAVKLTDGNLVSEFVATKDEEAFAELVRRHGPMVLATCRRILYPDVHTAEDAFQAAFLVLVTKTATIQPPERVGAWLYGVSVQVAKKARFLVRRSVQMAQSDMDKVSVETEPVDAELAELRTAIDEVLTALPLKYRTPVILCELEGKSRADAAKMLGWSEGTLSSRLARARKLLADRMSRRGFALPTAGLGAVLLAQPVTARVPPHLVASTVQAAMLVAAGSAVTVISKPVAALMRGGYSYMTTKFKVLTIGIAGIGLVLGGFGLSDLLDARTIAAPSTPLKPFGAPFRTYAVQEKPAPAAPKGWVVTHSFTYKNPVSALAFGADIVAVGDKAGTLSILDAKTGKEKERIYDGTEEHAGAYNRIQLSPDGSVLHLVTSNSTYYGTCSVNKEKRSDPGVSAEGSRQFGTTADGSYWIRTGNGVHTKDLYLTKEELAEKNFIGSPEVYFSHKEGIDLADAANTETVTTISGGVLRCWKKGDAKLQEEVKDPAWETKLEKFDPVKLVVSSDGKKIAVSGKKGEVWLFAADSGKLLGKLTGHRDAVNAVAFSADGKQIVTGSEDKTARVWDADTFKELASMKDHKAAVTAVSFSPGCEMIASASAETVKVWEYRR
jgi:RNA polymerase sigma factor (sigma-70 family)